MNRIMSTSLTALALAIGGQAHAAGYSVAGTSNATAGGIYDHGGEGCRYNFNATGGVCSGGGSTPANTSGAVTPLGGDNSATAASMTASASGAGASATSRTAVDLSTGSIHFYGSDTNVTGNCSTPLACGGTAEYARYADTLHFTIAGATSTTVTPIALIFTLEGVMKNLGTDTTDTGANGEIFGQLNFGHSDARFDLKSNSGTGYLTQVNYLDTYPSNAPGVWTTNADHTINTYTENYLLTGASVDLAVALEASLQCNTGYLCDFANTAKLGLTLPTGTSFTSDSGVFLKGDVIAPPTGAVPEPATWAMMLLGFGLTGVAMRRQRRVPQCA